MRFIANLPIESLIPNIRKNYVCKSWTIFVFGSIKNFMVKLNNVTSFSKINHNLVLPLPIRNDIIKYLISMSYVIYWNSVCKCHFITNAITCRNVRSLWQTFMNYSAVKFTDENISSLCLDVLLQMPTYRS